MKKICVVLVGNIGSGKSTLAKDLVNEGYIAVSRDQIRYAIGDGKYIFQPEFENAVHSVNMCLFYKFMELEQNLIVDETNVTKEIRENYVWAAKNRGYTVIAIELPRLTKEESVARRLSSNHCSKWGDDVWGPVWDRFDRRYKAPTTEEGFDVVVSLSEDSEPGDAVRIIQNCLNGLEENGS